MRNLQDTSPSEFCAGPTTENERPVKVPRGAIQVKYLDRASAVSYWLPRCDGGRENITLPDLDDSLQKFLTGILHISEDITKVCSQKIPGQGEDAGENSNHTFNEASSGPESPVLL